MTYYPGQNWPKFCKNFPVKLGRQIHIQYLYKFTMCWKNSFKLYKEIDELKDSKNELVKEKEVLEKKNKELIVFKEQTENLAKKVEKLMLDYSELSEEDTENERIYWQIGELEELLEKIKKGELSELNEVVMRIIEKWEIDAKTHFISFTETGKLFNDAQRAALREEIRGKSEIIQKSRVTIENQEREIQKLREELKDNSELLRKARKTIQAQEALLNLYEKPLPSLPKKANKFQQLGTKIKTNFLQLKENVKLQKQAIVARMEIPIKK
jgi:DNA repair exonuclease SbcCD ATPase subunit